jgi:chemotaxis protein methyltransferase CheR
MTQLAPTLEWNVNDESFAALCEYIVSATGLEFYAERPQALVQHIAQRMDECGSADCASYLRHLQYPDEGAHELDRLVELLTIGETYFFRHTELFDALRCKVFPEIIERKRDSQRLRIWSAGCSIGAEVYSLAIMLRRELADLVRGWDISLLGTDINRTFLAHAESGRYEAWSFRGTRPELRRDCFNEQGAAWQIDPRFQRGVRFQYHNLAGRPFLPPGDGKELFDLIVCRNVLIYFGREIADRVAMDLAGCLEPDGWLAVGHAEHGHLVRREFEAVQFPGAILYRKTAGQNGRSESERFRPAPLPGSLSLAPGGFVPSVHGPHAAMAAHSRDTASPAIAEHAIAPQPPFAWDRMQALADAGRLDEALLLCKAQVEMQPLDAPAHFFQALLLNLAGRQNAALKSLQKAIYLDREFALAHYYCGLIHENLRHIEKALASFGNVPTLLAGRPDCEPISQVGELTIGELRALAGAHIELLEAS